MRIGRLTDRTEAVETIKRLATERERFEIVLHGTRLGLCDWKMQTGETKFNERWAEIAGYELQELETVSIQTWMSLANEEDLAGSDEPISRHAAGELPYYDVEASTGLNSRNWSGRPALTRSPDLATGARWIGIFEVASS